MLTTFVLITSVIGSTILVCGGQGQSSLNAACNSWNKWKDSLQHNSEFSLLCNVNKYCTGMDCAGKYQDLKVNVALLVQHCLDPVSVEIRLSAPQLNIYDWHHTFTNGETYPLPEVKHGPFQTNLSLVVYLRHRDEGTVIIECSVLARPIAGDAKSVNSVPVVNETIRFPPCIKGPGNPTVGRRKSATILRSLERPVGISNEMTATQNVGKNCNLSALFQCGVNEICDQVRGSQPPIGACICLSDFHWDRNGICAPIVPFTDATTDNPGKEPTQNLTSVTTALQIALPILLIALTATLAVLAYKFHWVTKLRVRLQRQTHVYEEMLIDGDEVNSIHSLSTNPVA